MHDAPDARADEIREAMATSAFHTWMGMRVVDVQAGTVDLVLDVADHHVNLQGFVHGGVLAALADTAAGLAVRSIVEPGSRHVTVNLDMQYLRAVRSGALRAKGAVTKAGTRIAFAEASVTDAGGTVLARANVTVAVSAPT
jgi:uncharacterized protein (TIGR00369 family)